MVPMNAKRPSAPAPETRTERRKARTAKAILDAAERLFLSHGFEATTMYDLSSEADVAVTSIYAHFGSKDGVYAALIDRALELDERYSREGLEGGSSPLERLVGMAEGYLRFARQHPAYFRFFRFPPPDRPAPEAALRAAARVSERIRTETARIAELLREAIDEGVVRQLDPQSTAAYLWAAWDGVLASHLGPSNMDLSDAEFEQVLEQAREAMLLGLVAPERRW